MVKKTNNNNNTKAASKKGKAAANKSKPAPKKTYTKRGLKSMIDEKKDTEYDKYKLVIDEDFDNLPILKIYDSDLYREIITKERDLMTNNRTKPQMYRLINEITKDISYCYKIKEEYIFFCEKEDEVGVNGYLYQGFMVGGAMEGFCKQQRKIPLYPNRAGGRNQKNNTNSKFEVRDVYIGVMRINQKHDENAIFYGGYGDSRRIEGGFDMGHMTGLCREYLSYNSERLVSEGYYHQGKKHGHVKYFVEYGRHQFISKEGNYLNDVKHDRCFKEYYHEYGSDYHGIKYIGSYQDGKQIGWWLSYDRTGKLENRVYKQNFADTGFMTDFFKNGQIKYIGHKENNLCDGFGTDFYSNGVLHYSGNFALNKIHGENIVKYHSTGKVASYGKRINGSKEGHYYIWRKDGSLAYISEFKNDEKNGYGTFYHENGTKAYEGNYKQDKRDGEGNAYFENGVLNIRGTWKNGLSHGFPIEVYFQSGQISYRGTYKMGKKHKKGILYDQYGKQNDVKYCNGVLCTYDPDNENNTCACACCLKVNGQQNALADSEQIANARREKLGLFEAKRNRLNNEGDLSDNDYDLPVDGEVNDSDDSSMDGWPFMGMHFLGGFDFW